jgi:hypothetical protein
MPYNMMIGYAIYDCFTMEHFLLRQRMILDDQNLLLATVPARVGVILLKSKKYSYLIGSINA